jgi:ABC-type lipoprotein export system ATPase subunit
MGSIVFPSVYAQSACKNIQERQKSNNMSNMEENCRAKSRSNVFGYLIQKYHL